jgi:hypothetical protein
VQEVLTKDNSLQRIEKEMSGEARDMFAAYIPQGDMARYASDLPRKLRADLTGATKLLARQGLSRPVGQLPSAAQNILGCD